MHRMVLLFAFVCACAPAVVPVVTPVAAPAMPISAMELRRDLLAFAADSFLGRETGTPNEVRAARFLVNRVMSLGMEPAGDSLYYQRVPLIRESFGPSTRFAVTQGQAAIPLSLGTDIVPWVSLGAGVPLPKRNASGALFFAGYGMVGPGRSDFQGITAAGTVIVLLHGAPRAEKDTAVRRQLESQEELGLRIGRALQFQPAAIVVLTVGKTTEFYQQMVPYLTRSVVPAPGDQTTSDAQRPLPMVVLGVAKAGSPLLPSGWPTDESSQPLTGRVQPGMSPDSIANGADDDASGSVTLLAIAKAMMAARPKRSTMFVWHAAEEKGLLGSAYFTAHPTVPIDSIVAHINSDMIGRRAGATPEFNSSTDGAAAENRIYVIGPRAAPNNQSRTLGAILDTVNRRQVRPLDIGHELDAPNHPERYYERSDHYNYAQKGIPVLMFSTGFHEDYHKVSDEVGKIDFDKMARIGSLMLEFGYTLANRDARPR
jgi:hypothetical protein